ncbi:SDR family NAD(P)-dependent oxidoreductase [Brucella tritici]|uniref:SDR family NAD(P)-dependent oxidoreductase n=1 Tax=Brucella tritici TaxID=94626 RepID=UPI002000D50B|nr:SDR family oxidoreductase [Brucella tritici]
MMDKSIKDLFGLNGQTVLITGAARGIGLETSRLLAAVGARIFMVDRDESTLQEAHVNLVATGADAAMFTADLAEPDAPQRIFESFDRQYQKLDILINNAALVQRLAATELTPERWRQAMTVNLDATFELCRLAHPRFKSNGSGAIVNMASIMALSGGGFYPIASYHASKGGVVHLTRALAVEWGADAIRVNAIAPSWIKTDFNSDFLEQDGIAETLLASVPLKKFGTTQDVAAAVLYLVSPAASMITGHILAVDGGFLAH